MKSNKLAVRALLATGALCTAAAALPAHAATVDVAVAANFTAATKRLVPMFEKATGNSVRVSFGSTGKLYAQIRNGAPFGVFLAADARRPRLLAQEGVAVASSRFTYAQGKLALWSAKPGYVTGPAMLKQADFSRIAMANPKTAPYGAAAVQVMKNLGVWTQLSPRVVQGENIAQTFQFVYTANAPLGFVALAEVKALKADKKGSSWVVPQKLYAPIEQQAVLLKRGADNPAATAFVHFLKSPAAKRVIAGFGYGVK